MSTQLLVYREVDDGILVYIAIDNTPLWRGIHVDWRSGLARPDQSAGHVNLKR